MGINLRTWADINRLLGTIEGATAGLEHNVGCVICDAVGAIDELLNKEYSNPEVDLLKEENARLCRINVALQAKLNEMEAHKCVCDCDWRQDDGK